MKLNPVLSCPNTPPCPHWLHDIEDYDDPTPMCVEEDCPCGKGEQRRAVDHDPVR